MSLENKIEFCENKEQASFLWKTCFPSDSPDFVSFYMNHVHKQKDSLVLLGEQGDPRAYLGMVPYGLQVGKKVEPGSYLSGVCTLPEFRGQGYMTAMMKRALRVMFDRGDVFSTLIPAKPDLYLKFGYTDTFFLEEKPLPKGAGRGGKTEDVPKLSQRYQQYCETHFSSFLVRTKEQWDILLEEHFRFEKGELWCNEGAYALVSRFGEKTVVKEAMGEDGAVHALLCQIGEGVLLSPDSQKPLGQARVVNVQRAMECLPDCKFRVVDPWIEENNGTYSVRNGVVTKGDEQAEKIEIGALTSLILQGQNYMNLMLN